MKTIKAAEIILDFDLYPRGNIDSKNVRDLMAALSSGSELPPVIIDKKTKRAVDGFHRIRAFMQLYGDDAKISVVEKTYANDAELFMDAMRYNASHGAKLDSCDRTRCTIIAERLSIPIEAVAGALHMEVDTLASLRTYRTATGQGGLTPLKRTNAHMAGKKLTKQQEEANKRSSGMNQVFYVNQLVDLIEAKLLDTNDEKLFERLRHLHGLLEALLVT